MIRSAFASVLLLVGVLFVGEALAAPMELPGLDSTRYQLVWHADRPLAADDEAARRSQTVEDLSVEERKKIQARLKVRRQVVGIHQVLSFSTTGLLLAAEVFGVINFVAIDKGSPVYNQLKPSLGTHRVLVGAALSTYLAAGITAWTMPPAYKANIQRKPGGKKKVDSGKVHVALSVGHGIGMAAMLVSGALMANAADNKAWKGLAVYHTAFGITTAALVLSAGIVINTL